MANHSRRMIRMTFTSASDRHCWCESDDAAGDFIPDAKADRQHAIESWEALQAYLRSRDVDAGVLTAAREVWDRYAKPLSGEAVYA